MRLYDVLAKISVINRDNGLTFTNTSRLDAISECLSSSRYSRINSAGLFHLYSPSSPANLSGPVIIISSHVDCELGITKCFSELLPGGMMRGTYDNSITNAAILYLMLQDKLPDNVLIAFTGDEEEFSHGADDVMKFMKDSGISVHCVIVLDVTDMGWDERVDFTVENNFWDDYIGMKVIMSAQDSGYNWCFVPSDPDEIPKYIDSTRVIPVEADEDESWEYDKGNLPCFSLCIPVRGDMHSNEGVYARFESFTRYTTVIEKIASSI